MQVGRQNAPNWLIVAVASKEMLGTVLHKVSTGHLGRYFAPLSLRQRDNHNFITRISLFGFQDVDHNEERKHTELAVAEGKPSMQEMLEVESKNGESKTGQCASAFSKVLEEAEEESGGIENDNVDIDEDAPTKRCSTDRMRDLFLSLDLQTLDSIKLSVRPTTASKDEKSALVGEQSGILGWIQHRREHFGGSSSVRKSSLGSPSEDATESTADCSEANEAFDQDTLSASAAIEKYNTPHQHQYALWVISAAKRFAQERMDTFSRSIRYLTKLKSK